MTIRPLAAFLLTTFSLASFAATPSVPNELQFNGKPIDALCFEEIPKNNIIQLNNCGIAKDKYRMKGQNEELSKKGYIGFDWQDPSGPSEVSAYSYYKFFAADKSHYWIYAINNTGGTGEFTMIYLAERTGANTLKVKPIVGGDRCNGGVQDVTDKGGKLSYSVNLTAYDLTTLAKKELKNVKAYDDLAACAVCCVANAYYQVDTHLKPTLNYVELGKVASDSELPTQGKYQACFNQLTMEYMKKNQLKLEPAATDAFVKKFSEQCVKTS